MTAPAPRLRRWLKSLRRTPLHPQWLLGGNTHTIDWVRSHASGRVLDIGCADRWIEPHLPEGCNYIGLDYLATGGLMYGARPDVFADASQLPLPDASIDTVLLLEVLEHLRHPAQALSEIARVLRPGGQLLLTMPFLYPIHDAPHDYQRLTRHGLVRDAEATGFHVDEVSGRLGSINAAGLIACLSLAGTATEALRRRSPGMVLVPLMLLLVPIINLAAWCGNVLLPSWDALTNGYLLVARKP